MVQTRAQKKTVPSASGAASKPAPRRPVNSATAASTSRAKPKSQPTETEDAKPVRIRTVTKPEDAKPVPKPRKKVDPKPASEPKARTRTKPASTSAKEIIIQPRSTRAVTVDTQPKRKTSIELKKDGSAEPKKIILTGPKKVAAPSSRLGNPIKPKRKPAIPSRKDAAATEKPLLETKLQLPILPHPTTSNSPSKSLEQQPQTVDTTTNSSPEDVFTTKLLPETKDVLPPPTPAAPTSIFKSSILSPTKSLGSAIKAPMFERLAKAYRLVDSPRRGTPLIQANIRREFTADMHSIQKPEFAGELAHSTIGLSPFKPIGTPIRRPINSSLFSSSKISATAKPPKRFATDSPWRPMSVRGEKRPRLDATPQRPRTADDGLAPLSCMKSAMRMTSNKKAVSFQSPRTNDENDGSPKRRRQDSKFAPTISALPRLSEGQESDIGAESEVEPLPLSDILNIEFSQEDPSKTNEPPSILGGLMFYVDVCGSDGSSANQYFSPLLEELGAKITDIWTDDVTHVLFKDGDEKTLKRVAQSKGSVKCVNVGWSLDCERYQCRMPEESYKIALNIEPSTPGAALRTPLRPLDSNRPSPTPCRTISKTPGTMLFDAKIQAIRDARIKTPDFSSMQMDVENMQSPDYMSTPLMLKSCPPKQTNQPLHSTDDSLDFHKKLFKGARKSLGAALMMKWVDDDE